MGFISNAFDKYFGNQNPSWTVQRNKVAYLVGSCYMLASAFIIGYNPCLYAKFSSIGTTILLLLRIFQFTYKNWYLYLIDFCYYVNILFIYSSFSEPNQNLLHAVYGYSFAILPSVILYGNTLTPHCLELFTNAYIHLNPCLAFAVIQLGKCNEFECDFRHFLQTGSEYYFYHVGFYYVLIFLVVQPFREDRPIANLYSYWIKSLGMEKNAKKFPKFLQGIVYLFCLGIFHVIGISSTTFACNSNMVCAGSVGICAIYAIHRAGNYYLVYLPKVKIT